MEVYQLSRVVHPLRIELFFVLFDWYSSKDVLGVQEWKNSTWRLRVITEAEWRNVTVSAEDRLRASENYAGG